MPGRWLLAIARIVFDEFVLTTVVHQSVADMRDEWLRAGSNRLAKLKALARGYVAFWSVAILAVVVLRPRSVEMTTATRVRLVVLLFVLGLGAGYAYARQQPPMYRSAAILQGVPPPVPAGVADPGAESAASFGSRLQTVSQTVISRTRLEGLITDLNLYQRERQSLIMEDVVAMMRKHVSIQVLGIRDTFQIAYTGSDPVTVLKATERIAAHFIDENLKQTGRASQNGLSQPFGINLLEAPRLPTQPLERTHWQVTLLGGVIGVALAIVIALIDFGRRQRQDRRRTLAGVTN